MPLVTIVAPLPIARVPTPSETALIVPITEEPVDMVSVAPVLIRTFPETIDLLLAKFKDPDEPPPTVTVVAFIASLAVTEVLLATVTANSPVVEPSIVPVARVVVDPPFKLTVPTPVEAPLTTLTNVPLPIFKVDPELRVIAVEYKS